MPKFIAGRQPLFGEKEVPGLSDDEVKLRQKTAERDK